MDALFGFVLVAVGLTGGNGSGPSAAAPSSQGVELTTRLGNVAPPGQSTGFAVREDGSLALVDRGRQVIVRLDANGQRTAEWGPAFGPNLDAKDMVGLAVDGDGWAVLDRGAQRVLRLDNQGHAVVDKTINLEPLATYGPTGLASDGRGNLYMADTGRDRIVVFDSNGKMSASVGDSGTELGKFKQPMFAAFAPDGAMLVTDWENARVERFDADRQPTNAWPVPAHAWGITVDSLGRVFVPDVDHRLVRMFGPDGSVLAQFGGTETGGTPLPVDAPTQVAVSPDANTLWILGVDGVARADLSAFAAIRPATPPVSRAPLAALGTGLIALAIGTAAWPYRRVRPGWRFRAPPPAEAPAARPSDVLAPRGLVLADLAVSPQVSVIVGLGLTTLGLLAAIVAELIVAAPQAKLQPWPRLFALAVASLVFAVGCGLSARALPCRWVSEWPPRCVPCSTFGVPRLRTISAFVVAAILAGASAFVWFGYRFMTPEATGGAVLWLGAVAIVVAVTAWHTGRDVRRGTWNLERGTLMWTLLPWALFAVALVPRAWDNANLPYGVWFDEAEGGLQARRLLLDGRFTPITDTYGRDASLYYYLMAAAQALIKDPVLAQRLVSAVVGAACALLIYWMGRELFGWRVGLAAGVLLAASRWHLDVSRLGWDPISLPFCAILAIWLLARSVRTQRWTDAVWAGLALGLGLHGYIGSRTLPIVGLAMLVYAAWWLRWKPTFATRQFTLVLLAALLVALPVVVFAVQDPAGFNGRLNQTLILNEPVSQQQKLDEIWSNVQKHLLMFHISGDLNGRHNLPGAPMLDVVSGLLAMLGLGVLLSRPFDWRSIVLVGWGVVSLLGGILTFPFEAPQAMRTLGMTPLLAILVALALALVVDRVFGAICLVTGRRESLITVALTATGAGVAAVIAWINITTFFGTQMNDPTVWESFSTRETIPSREVLASTAPLEAVLGSPTIAPSLQQQLLIPDKQGLIRTFDASRDLPYRGSGPALIILETEHEAGLADEVARYYPDATRRPIIPPNSTRPTATELMLDPTVLAAHRGLHAQGDTWRGLVSTDRPGAYAFRSTTGAAVSVDGAELQPTQTVQLARGNHVLTIRGPRPLVQWHTPTTTEWQPIDPAALFVAPEGGTGLQATFYPSADFQGTPTEVVIDPIVAHYYHTSPFARLNLSPPIWSVEWRGEIDVPTSGAYRFEAERLSRAGLWIDDRTVFDDITTNSGASGQIQLTAGRHQIRVRLQDRGDGGPRMYLYWTPPSSARELVPGRVLYPPRPQ